MKMTSFNGQKEKFRGRKSSLPFIAEVKPFKRICKTIGSLSSSLCTIERKYDRSTNFVELGVNVQTTLGMLRDVDSILKLTVVDL